jgi:YVTN family beta-propeller protein
MTRASRGPWPWLLVPMLVLAGCERLPLPAAWNPAGAPETAESGRAVEVSDPPERTIAWASETPSPTPTPPPYSKLRVFVAAEYAGPGGSSGEVWAFEGGPRFTQVARIPAGAWPHNLSVSPNGRWVAAANRSGNSVSIIDPLELREVARVPVGRQPHDIIWHPDGKTIFVSNERDLFISRIEAESWRPLAPLEVGAPQHTLAIRAHRPHELYFTLTLFGQAPWQPNHLRSIDLLTGRIAQATVLDAHDVFYTPDGSEVWSTSSGFLGKPSDRIVIYEPETKAIKEVIRLPGRYPFHAMKENRDGLYHLPDSSLMVLSSHAGPAGPSLLFLDWRQRRIVGESPPLGAHVFHTTYDPLGRRLLTTSNVDGMINVIDLDTRQLIEKVPVPKPHGIVSVGIP